jgi:predicted HicB family RNase H-like nuclease
MNIKQIGGIGMETKISAFQLRILSDFSHEIKVIATQKHMSKHEYIERAIKEQMKRDKAV